MQACPGLCDQLVAELLTTLAHPQVPTAELSAAIARLTTSVSSGLLIGGVGYGSQGVSIRDYGSHGVSIGGGCGNYDVTSLWSRTVECPRLFIGDYGSRDSLSIGGGSQGGGIMVAMMWLVCDRLVITVVMASLVVVTVGIKPLVVCVVSVRIFQEE